MTMWSRTSIFKSWPAWMIACDDDCRRTCHDRQSKNLLGMTKDRIHRANGHQIMTFDTPTCVENENHQTFTFGIEVRMIRDVRFPISGCLVWFLEAIHQNLLLFVLQSLINPHASVLYGSAASVLSTADGPVTPRRSPARPQDFESYCRLVNRLQPRCLRLVSNAAIARGNCGNHVQPETSASPTNP